MALSLGFMMLGLLAGIFRLMGENSLSTGFLSSLYMLHPLMMVFGFLAAIVMTERVAGVSVIPDMKDSRVPSATVPLIALGVVSEIVGYTLDAPLARYFGASLLLAGCLVFAIVLLRLSSKTGVRLPFHFMILSVLSLSGAAVLSGFSLPAGDISFIMLLLSFPIIFILGERVELTRFTASSSVVSRFTIAYALAAVSVGAFLLASLPSSMPYIDLVSIGTLALLATMALVLYAESENFKLLAKSNLPLQRYVYSHTRVAYVWGMMGLTFALTYFASSFNFDLYDPFIHSLAVGFIGTMLLAHGPVILPSVTGRRLDLATLSKMPLVILTIGNALRIVGDLVLLRYNSMALSYVVGLSGWLILASVILFLREILGKKRSKLTLLEIKIPDAPKPE